MFSHDVFPLHTNSTCEDRANAFVRHPVYNILLILLIFFDTIFIMLRHFEVVNRTKFELVSFVLCVCFLAEDLFRVLLLRRAFFTVFNVLDFMLVTVCFGLYIDQIFTRTIKFNSAILFLTFALQVCRLFVRFIAQLAYISASARSIVGQNKQRYRKNGFDLDLAYITKGLIAMGLPKIGRAHV